MPTIQENYTQHVTSCIEQTRQLAVAYATQTGSSPTAFLNDVIAGLQASGIDGRAVGWRARIRLYMADDNYQQPIADSDPTLDADMAGTTVFAALPAIGPWLQETATEHHKAACSGLEMPNIKKKIAGLRTQLSLARSHFGTLRVDYFVMVGGIEKHMLARVDVERSEVEAKQQFRRTIR